MLRDSIKKLILAIALVGGAAFAQDPYLRPSLAEREALTDSSGVIPQLDLAMTNANVVDVRSGEILRGVTVAVRDGKILFVGKNSPQPGAEVAERFGRAGRVGIRRSRHGLILLLHAHTHALSVVTHHRPLALGYSRVIA